MLKLPNRARSWREFERFAGLLNQGDRLVNLLKKGWVVDHGGIAACGAPHQLLKAISDLTEGIALDDDRWQRPGAGFTQLPGLALKCRPNRKDCVGLINVDRDIRGDAAFADRAFEAGSVDTVRVDTDAAGRHLGFHGFDRALSPPWLIGLRPCEAGKALVEARVGSFRVFLLLHNLDFAGARPNPNFGPWRNAAQDEIDRLLHVVVDGEAVIVEQFDYDVERRRRLAFQNGLLGTAACGFGVAEGYGLDASDEVAQSRIEHQVLERLAVGSAHELDSPFRDRATCNGFGFGPDLVDDDDLGHVVFNRLDHHLMLLGGDANLHPPRGADARVGHVAIAGDFVAGIDDDYPLADFVSEDAGYFSKLCGFADAGTSEQQNRLTRADDAVDHIDSALKSAADTAC